MKITTFIIFAVILQVSAAGFAQKVTLSSNNARLTEVFNDIRNQTGYDFLFTSETLKDAKRVSIKVENAELKDVLNQLFTNQPLEYIINKKAVIVSKKEEPSFLDRVVDAFTPPINISGLVLDERGQPMAGVTVRVKGTNKATFTDNSGKFYLAGVDDDAVIEFRMVGYKVLELSAKGKFEGLKMEQVSNELDETIVVAYGTSTQRTNTGSLTIIKGEQIQSLPNRSFDKSLQGLVPGLQITNGTGQPGGGVSNMVLRGISTGTDAVFGSTVRNPLIVIDGIPVSQDQFQISIGQFSSPISNPLTQINPSDIESISVLKDAAAIALYGSKAGNGVILVTTKNGKMGRTVVNVRHQTDISFLPERQPTLNQEQYLDMLYATYKTTNPVLWADNAIRKDLLSKFPYRISGTDTSFYSAPDWIGEVFDKSANTFSNEISFSGGNEKGTYYLGLEYTKQDGIVKSTGYDRTSIRLNLENKVSKWLKIGVRNTFSYNDQNYMNPSENQLGYGMASMMSPLLPVRNEDGSYIMNYAWGSLASTGTSQYNPVAVAEYNISKNVSYRNLGGLNGELSFLKYFTLSSNLGVDFMLVELKEKVDPRFRQSSTTVGGSIIDRTKRRTNLISTNTLRFAMPIGDLQEINFLAGQEAQVLTEKMLSGEVRGTNTTLPIYDELSSPGYNLTNNAGSLSKQTLLSYFSQLNYGYLKKYFLSASIRKYGSSRFGSRQQWGTYWSAGAGWLVSEEGFLKNVPVIDYLKFRGSIGAAGSSGAVGPSTRFDLLSQTTFNGNTAIIPGSSPGNIDVRWEKTFSWDTGFEAKLLKNKLAITVDVYKKYTTDLIYSINLPSMTGYYTVMDNFGNIENSGVELSASGDIVKQNNFQWKLSANWSTNNNILKKANVPLTAAAGETLGNEEGRNFNSYYLREWSGVNPIDGKPQWTDANGQPTSTYNSGVRMFMGKPQPDAFGQVTSNVIYKGFDFAIQFYYQYGSLIYNENNRFISNDGQFPYVNQASASSNFWRKPGDIVPNPRRILNNSDRGNSASSRFLVNGDYIRLSNASLGYNFPKHTIQKLKLQQLKLYLQGNNLAVWKKYKGSDPDNANSSGSIGSPFPLSRTISAGIQLNL